MAGHWDLAEGGDKEGGIKKKKLGLRVARVRSTGFTGKGVGGGGNHLLWGIAAVLLTGKKKYGAKRDRTKKKPTRNSDCHQGEGERGEKKRVFPTGFHCNPEKKKSKHRGGTGWATEKGKPFQKPSTPYSRLPKGKTSHQRGPRGGDYVTTRWNKN